MEGIDEIRRLRKACEDMELENRELLAKYTDEQLSDMFNGIGHPAIALAHEDGHLEILRQYTFNDYLSRMD